ncbi:MAG: DNA methyltransferase, partial [Anaerolineales bacterium]
ALRDPEAALTALKQDKVCDPACGSGAYLLGMLHELLEKREALFAARRLDPHTLYERKREIIQNNLYGVDLDPFAVNIARLRLWLSLIVEYEGYPPPPLPNLDFKIETGDSLTAPDPSGGLQPDLFRYAQVQEFLRLKNDYLNLHAGAEEKKKLAAQIEALKAKIKEQAVPQSAGLRHDETAALSLPTAFDWQVEFAEVFAPDLDPAALSGGEGIPPSPRGRRAGDEGRGGFDILLANPPYVRQELIKDLKPALKRVYGSLYTGTADLYVYFYLRAHQLLKEGGVACFISSNKWLRANYGETLRQHLLDTQAFRLVVDFGELPVFQTAATFPAIFLWQKRPRWRPSPAGRGAGGEGLPTTWAVVKDLQQCYAEGIAEHVARIAQTVPAEQFGKGKARLAASHTADLRRRMEARGLPLGEYVQGKIYFGIKTGYNQAFLLDEAARQRLIGQDPKSAEIIKPLLVGDDVRRYEIHYRKRYLIWTYIGVPIERYPAVFAHLQKHQPQLEKRWDKGNHWWELRACDYYAAFEQPKIIYPIIGKEPRFVVEEGKFLQNDKTFLIAVNDWFLLGLLNSSPAFSYLKTVCSILGDEMKGGRLEFRAVFMEKLPIPEASAEERQAIAQLARRAQALHGQRRARVEQFLREIGIDPAQSTSRNSLEQPWRVAPQSVPQSAGLRYRAAREETLALTEEIEKVEREIDRLVYALYGLTDEEIALVEGRA